MMFYKHVNSTTMTIFSSSNTGSIMVHWSIEERSQSMGFEHEKTQYTINCFKKNFGSMLNS